MPPLDCPVTAALGHLLGYWDIFFFHQLHLTNISEGNIPVNN